MGGVTGSTKTPPIQPKKLGGLFLDEDEEESGDIFSQLSSMKSSSKSESSPAPAKKPTTSSLFSDEGEEGGALFSRSPITEEPPPEESPKPQKKRPAGAVPMFGGVDLFSQINKKKTESTSSGDLFGSPSNESPVVAKKPEPKEEVRGLLYQQVSYCLSVYSLLRLYQRPGRVVLD